MGAEPRCYRQIPLSIPLAGDTAAPMRGRSLRAWQKGRQDQQSSNCRRKIPIDILSRAENHGKEIYGLSIRGEESIPAGG